MISAVGPILARQTPQRLIRNIPGRARHRSPRAASPGNVRDVLAAGDPEERKAVVRNFLAGARVERAAGRIVLQWYRVPRSSWAKLVAVGGIEPPTRGL
jgi:hypothetical protein